MCCVRRESEMEINKQCMQSNLSFALSHSGAENKSNQATHHNIRSGFGKFPIDSVLYVISHNR